MAVTADLIKNQSPVFYRFKERNRYRPHDVKYDEDTEPAAREKVAVPNDWQWSNTQYLAFCKIIIFSVTHDGGTLT